MEVTTTDIQSGGASYGKDRLFDLEIGMAVVGPDGQQIGRVTEVAGFGSTQLGTVELHQSDERVTQAQTGTGYFKVKRDDTSDRSARDLCIPFHGIKEVTSEHGVVVNEEMIAELHEAGQRIVLNGPKPTSHRPWWHRLPFGH
jgi:hypothetical protein